MRAFRITFVLVGLVGLGMLAGGVISIIHKESGTPARATVTGCQQVIGARTTTYDCSGSWVEGGSLIGGNGHVVLGSIDDAGPSDVGKTISVRVSGDHAYTPSLRVPIILLVLGLLMALGAVFYLIVGGRQMRRTAQHPQGPSSPSRI
jgi:hypothetical protein